jgi:cobalt/nickel transport system ATP-binding protein
MDEPVSTAAATPPGTREAPPAFEVAEVHYAYDDVAALDGLTLRVEAGQQVALLGANGSGKSTLLRLLDALCFADSGKVTAFGTPLTAAAFEDEAFAFGFRRRVGFVFQDADVQLFSPSVFDEIAFGPLQLGWSADRVRTATEAMLDEMALGHLRGRPPHRLSGGEKKRVALACVLITDPEVLLLDEPTLGLDPESQSQVIDLLVDFRGTAKTVLVATHDLGIVSDIADDCHVLDAGRRVAHGSPQDILADDDLLRRTRLVHAHRHVHAGGLVHTHVHRHGHHHDHDDDA